MAKIQKEQIAAVNINYRMYSFDFFLDTQEKLGMKSIELWAGAPHFLLGYEGYQDCKTLREKVENRGLNIVAFTPESALYQFPVCAYNDEVRELAVAFYNNALHAANELGAKIMPLDIAGGLKTEDPEVMFDRAVKMLRILAPIAKELDVTIAVETMTKDGSAIINSLPELQRLLKAVDHPYVKAALDICAIRTARETLNQWFEAFGDDIVYIHFTDGRPAGHLVWGEGMHPLDTYLEILEKYNYHGYLGQNSNVRGMWFDASLVTDEEGFIGRDFYADNYWFYPPAADEKNLAAFAPYIMQ